MLINLRNALMTGKRLPYDAEVEWMNGSGAYVDTGVDAADDVGFRVTLIRTVDTTTDVAAFGTRASTVASRFFVGAPVSGKWYFGWNGRIDYGSVDINTPHTLGLNFLNNRKATFDDSEAGNLDGTITFSRRLFFPGYHRPTGDIDLKSGIYYKLCGCQITKGGNLLRDYIPVRVGTVGYLYDRVSRKLFGNAGTGDFVLGPDVVPVEYIESHGAEYIDTGYVYNAGSEFACDAMLMSVPSDTFATMFGALLSYNGVSIALNNTVPIQARFGASSVGNIVSDLSVQDAVGVRHKYDLSARRLAIDDDVFTRSGFTPYTVNRSIWLCSCNDSDSGNLNRRPCSLRVYAFAIYNGNTVVHKHLPVRVGTEGAMMDVLTRRIYRNAGTGAFTYGNDLKYPIPAA